jgi:hypothetical protein
MVKLAFFIWFEVKATQNSFFVMFYKYTHNIILYASFDEEKQVPSPLRLYSNIFFIL